MDLSIVIVNYNTCQITLNALYSVYQSVTKYSYEVIVIDNASSDSSVESIRSEYPIVRVIENTENLGFSKANNQGICMAGGRYILLLNSDTIIQSDTLDIMGDFMEENSHISASGCKIVLPDGSLDKACRRGFPTPSASFFYLFGISKLFPSVPLFNQYHLGYLDPDQDYPVDCLVGAFMFIRKEALQRVGFLDESFFMYGEDIDWCYRLKQAGGEIFYYPKTKIIHHKGASSRRKPFKIIYDFHRSMFLFHRKHYKDKYFFLVNLVVYVGITIKLMLSLSKSLLFQRG